MTNDLCILHVENFTETLFKTEKSLRNSVLTPWSQGILLGIAEIHTFLLNEAFCKGSTVLPELWSFTGLSWTA